MSERKQITDEQVVKRANAAVKMELEKKKIKNQPIAVFDKETRQIYMQYNDGTKAEIREIKQRGRYSERKKQNV
ncbi:hypothetical protein AALA24_05935 [Anaerovoracaceae bacterium 42-11]